MMWALMENATLPTTFEPFGLHERLLQVLPELGFEKPTPIQQQAIPVVLSGRDLLGSAQTGTGKTAAFLLPALHLMLEQPGRGCQMLVLEPTRELALQVEEHARTFAKYTSVRCFSVHGGVAFGPQEKAFQDGVEIIAATPGRLLDHLRQGNARFDGLRILVLDEVDRMLDMGFLPDVRSILRQLPERRQTLFFSATVPGEIGRLADGMLKDPVRIAITPERKTAEGVTQQVYPVSDHLKPLLLEVLLSHEHVTSALVFTRTKQGADKVCAVVERQGLPVNRIHGDLSQSQRLKALAQFKNAEVKFLVATDIAARGLDVEGISHVINYDVPDAPEDYIHRVGRTARAGETGHAYTLFSPRDAGALAAIERHIGSKIERVTMPDFNYEEPLGLQHEVRQGHNVRDYEDLGLPGGGAFTSVPRRAFKDSDERASVLLLYSPDATEADAVPSEGGDGRGSAPQGGGDGDGGPRRRQRRRGRRGGSGEGASSAPRESGPARGGDGRDGRRGGEGRGGEGRGGERRDRHQANAALSASDVLRRASDQKAVVSSDMLELRPRGEAEAEPAGSWREDSAEPGQEPARDGSRAGGQEPNRAPGEGGGKRRRRRRRGRGGRGGAEEAGSQATQVPQSGQGGQRPQDRGPREQRQDRGRDGREHGDGRGRGGEGVRGGDNGARRPERMERPERREGGQRPSESAKPSLWQRLKTGIFGNKPTGGGSLGDKW